MTRVNFDFHNNTISLDFTCSRTGKTTNITKHLNINNTASWKSASIEYKYDEEAKWVFKWKQYGKYEQFFTVDQYLPWKMGPFPQPRHYKPWTTIAQWSYIAEPSKYTIQTNEIYKNYYHESCIVDLTDTISFEVIGMDNEIYDWKTDDTSATGYYY